MLEVLWCEDDEQQRYQYKKIVQNYLLMKNISVKFVGAYRTPSELLAAAEMGNSKYKLFFLDIEYVDVNENGLDLAQRLRELYPLSEIVFVTTHDELLMATMERSVEPLGFVMKESGFNEVQSKVNVLLSKGYDKYTNVLASGEELFHYNNRNSKKAIPLSDVLYLETVSGTHKIMLYTRNGLLTFSTTSIVNLEKENATLFRCSSGFLVNIKNAISMDESLKTLTYENGGIVNISTRNIKKAKTLFEETHKGD